MRWTVRKADILKDDRDLFERYGETVIALVVANNIAPIADDLKKVLPGDGLPGKLKAARDWLTESRDLHERKETRLECVEWAILLFVALSFVLEGRDLVSQLAHHWCR
jgi:hypothetical protein